MTITSNFGVRGTALAAATLASLLLAACGGGDGLAGLSTEVAQGYGADAAGMPVSAGEGILAAAEALESGVAVAAGSEGIQSAPGRMQIESMQPQATATGSAACAGGGTAAWTVDGPAGTLGNRQLDAGETYSVTYTGCASVNGGLVLDGSVQWVVAARSVNASDITATVSNLRSVTAVRTATLNGNKRLQRTTVFDPNGGRTTTALLTSSGMTLASVIGTRNASYTLNSLNWTVVRTFNGAGALTARSHSGSLSMAASTPRRPNATLDITSQGMTVDNNGLVSSGSFTVVTDRNTIACTHGGGTVSLTLDLGNDGTIDRRWTLTRQAFEGEAG